MKDIYKSKKQLIKELEDMRRKAPQGKTGTIEDYPARAKADLVSDAPDYKRDKESLLLIRKAIDSATDAIGLSDPEGHHVYQNKAFTNLFEYTAEELAAVGNEAAFAVKSAAREVFGSIMSGRSWIGEVEMRSKSGRVFGLFLRADAIKNDEGSIVGLVAVFTDIAERKWMEYELRKKHDELQLILDSIPAYVFYKDKDGKMLNINKAAMALAYAPKEKLLQKTVFDLMPATADKYNRDDMEVMRSGQPKINIEESLELPSGKKWLKTDKLPIKDDDGNIVGLLGFSVDITDRKKAQEELYEKEALLRSFFNSPGLVCGVVELEGDDIRYITVNAAMSEMYGLTPEAVSNKLASEIGTDRGIAELFIKNYKKSRESNAPAYFEYHRGVGQEMRWFYVTATFLGLESASRKPRYAFVTTDITERRKAEEALRNSEEKLRVMFESMTNAVVLTDLNGVVLDVNAAACKTFGYSKDELIGLNSFNVVAPEDKERAARTFASDLQTPEIAGVQEYKILAKNGLRISAEISANRLADVTGIPYGLIVVIRDVTVKKAVEEALRESEQKLRLIFESIKDGILIVDLDGRVTEVNRSVEGIIGYSREQLIGQSGLDYIFPGFKGDATGMLQKVIAQGGTQKEVVVPMKIATGKIIEVEATSSVLHDNLGAPIGLIGTVRDVSERRRMEEELRNSEEKLRLMFASMADGVVVTDIEGKITEVNDAQIRMFGYKEKSELIDKGGFDFLAERERGRALADMFKVYEKGFNIGSAYTVVDKHGREFECELSTAMLHDVTGKSSGAVTVMRDVTERKKAEGLFLLIRKAVDSSSDAIGISDAKGHHFYQNKAFTDLFGYTAEDLEAAGGGSAVYVNQVVARKVFDTIMGGGAWNGEVEMASKGGRRYTILLRADVIKDGDGKIVGLVGAHTDITQRKRTEDALKESEARYRLLEENVSDVLWIMDLDLKYLYVSPSIERMRGFTPDEFLGMTAWDYISKESLDIAAKRLAAEFELEKTGGANPDRVVTIELEVKRKDGSWMWTEAKINFMRDNEGKSIGLLGITRDISERRKTREALREANEKLQVIFDSMGEAVTVVDLGGNIVDANKEALRLHRFGSKDEIIGRKASEMVAPADRDRAVSDSIKVSKSAYPPGRTEYKLIDTGGREFDGEFNVAVIKDNRGKPAGFIGIARDISERKKAEAALRASEREYRQLIETLQEGIWAIDKEANTTFVNPRMAGMLGYTPEEMQGKHLFSFMDERGVEIAQRNLERRRQGVTEQHDFEFMRKDGSRIYTTLETGPIIDEKGEYIGALAGVQDITQRKHAEEDVKRHAKRVEALYGIAQVLSQSSTLDAMLKDTLLKVCAAMDTESGCIFMLDLDENALKLSACKGVSESTVQQFSTIVLTEEGIERIMGLSGPVTEIDETHTVTDVTMVQKVTAELNRNAIAAVPFFRGKDMQGVVVVFTTKERTFSREDQDLLKAISNEMSIGINNMMLLEKTRELSVTDELTGLYNRRYFFEMLDVEMNRAGRTKHPFSLVMLDLDGFKEYNDKYGHTNGDTALQTVSQMLKSSIRKSDMAFRYGGDEFALILPSADAERAKKIVHRARAKWQKAPLAQAKILGGHVGFSTGIAEYPKNAESADGLIFLADAALYQAKKKGYEDKIVSELRTLSTDIMDVATQDQVYALAATVDARDPYTYGHSQRVAEIAMSIGKQVGLSSEDLVKLHAAALLHDIGKVGVPDAILTKMGKPTPEEWDVIKKHCSEGARIVSYVKELASLVPIILHHHEWYDGSGYPGGLEGMDIPSGARITSVADAYDTMVTKRPYRDVVTPREACEDLKRNAGTQFDPVIVDVWCKLVKKEGKQGR